MKIKITNNRFIQNGYFSKAMVKVFLDVIIDESEVTSILKDLGSFTDVYHPTYYINQGLYFDVEASTIYDVERETEPFDKIKGHDIAENKAIIKAYKTAIKVLRHLEKIRAREMNNLEDVIGNKLIKQLNIRSEIIGD